MSEKNRLDAPEFLEKLKAVNGSSAVTSDREIVVFDWVGEIEGDEDSGHSVICYGPDPGKLDFLSYMEFLAEIYKFNGLKDFVYAYIFSRLE